jgi:ABC-type glucose/galactose transport system permease subunit
VAVEILVQLLVKRFDLSGAGTVTFGTELSLGREAGRSVAISGCMIKTGNDWCNVTVVALRLKNGYA